jgi:hypothetical protein
VTIRKGEEWGTTVTRPAHIVMATSDAELARLIAADPQGVYGLTGGDLFRTVGSPAAREVVQRLPIDAIEVEIDDRTLLAVAHVHARRSWWKGAIVAVMNTDHVGACNVAPRAHPNDGRLDVVEVDPRMSVRARLQARSRLPQGTHVPHPCIAVRTVTEATWEFVSPAHVFVDGAAAGRCRRLRVRVLADHSAIYV